MNDLIFYGNVIVELREDTLAKMQLLERSYRKDYGGRQCLNMLRNMLRPAMNVREWENHPTMMSFLYTLFIIRFLKMGC
jgi:hypothetical protein